MAGSEGAGFVGEVLGDFECAAEVAGALVGGADGRALGFDALEACGGLGVERIEGVVGGGGGGDHAGKITGFVGAVKGFVWVWIGPAGPPIAAAAAPEGISQA